MGGHLIDDHGLVSRTGSTLCHIFILKNSSPRSLKVNEQLFIKKLRTLRPNGINSCNSFSIPLLFENKTFDSNCILFDFEF